MNFEILCIYIYSFILAFCVHYINYYNCLSIRTRFLISIYREKEAWSWNYAVCHTARNPSILRNNVLNTGVRGVRRQSWTRPCWLMIVALMTSPHTHVCAHRVTISPSNSRTRRKTRRGDSQRCFAPSCRQLWMISACVCDAYANYARERADDILQPGCFEL